MSDTLRAVLVVVVGLGLAGLAGVSAAAQEPPGVDLVDRSPWVTVGGTLTLDLALTDSVDAVEVRMHGPLADAVELAESRQADEGPILFTGTFPVADLASVSDGATRVRLDVSDTVNEGTTVRMAYAGVYPLVITPLDADGRPGDPIRTPVIRKSGAGTDLDAPDLAVAVDVSAAPTATVSGDRRAFDDPELSRFGRLATFLERAARDAPVGALVSADTLAGLAASDAPEAADLLDALARDGVTVIPQPTVPVDWGALAAAGLAGLVPDLIDAGRTTVADLLPDARVDTDTWDATGGIDVESLDHLADGGFERVLVSSTRLRHDDELSQETDTAQPMAIATGGPEDVDVLAADAVTAGRLTLPTTGPDAAHVVLADLVLRAPAGGTTVLAVLDDLRSDAALSGAFDLLADPDSPVSLTPLDSPAADEDVDDDDLPEPTPVDLLPPDGDEVDALVDLGPRVREAHAAVDTYAGIVGDDIARAAGARAVLAASLQRGLTATDRDRLLSDVEDVTATAFDNLHFTGPGDLNLTSRTGSLPIGVINRSDTPVTAVLTARSERLGFPDGDAITVVIPPGETRLDLAVRALATGSVPLFVELHSPDGTTVFDTRQLNVRSTAVSGVGLVLSIGALLVLTVWWVRTWRAGRRRRETSTSSEESKTID